MEKQDPLINPETGNEIQKCFYISVPYFPGLSESFKKIFKYTPVQVCFKGVNTLKSILMHPKDRISNDQKKDLVYHWECKADGCNSSYIGETSRALGERVKEHSKSTTSAILKHCKDFHHPLPSIDDFNIIDKEPSQVTREAKEAIHIRRLDPSLNRNIGKMSIPQCFDNLLGAKPKHPRVGELSAAPLPVEVAPPLQIPGLNLTQFNNIGNFRPNVAIHIPRRSTRACRAKNLFNWSINWRCHNIKASSLTPDMNWVVSFLQVPPKHFHTFNRCQNLIATVLHTPQTLSKITEPPDKGVKINLHSSSSLIHKCQNYFPYIYHPLQVFSSSLLMKTSCLRLKLVELNFLVSFNTDDQSKTDVANAINVITYKSKSSRWTFSINYNFVLGFHGNSQGQHWCLPRPSLAQ